MVDVHLNLLIQKDFVLLLCFHDLNCVHFVVNWRVMSHRLSLHSWFIARFVLNHSRLSGGSTHSEVITTSDRKKRGLFGKLKQLTRSSHSVDRDSDTSQFDPGSDTSLEDSRGRRDLKDRITGMFRKSGSTSRGNSVEKKLPPSGNLSDSGGNRTLLVPRSSPSRSESGGIVKKVPPGSAPILRKVRK